jgi:hypothetical protein
MGVGVGGGDMIQGRAKVALCMDTRKRVVCGDLVKVMLR